MADVKKLKVGATAYDIKDEIARQQLETKQDAINEVNINYVENNGSPSASVDFQNGELAFTLKNMKMKFSELTATEKAELKGEKGAQGDSVLVGQGDLPLAHVLGQDNTKAMSQKGVTEAIQDIDTEEWESVSLSSKSNLGVNSSTRTVETKSSAAYIIYYMEVSAGDFVKYTPSLSSNKKGSVYMGNVVPVAGAVATTEADIFDTDGEEHRYYVQHDGYVWFYVNYSQTITAQKAKTKIEALESRLTNAMNEDMLNVKKDLYGIGYDEKEKVLTKVAGLRINTSTNKAETASNQDCYYAAVNKGDKLLLRTSISANINIRVGFCSSVPANNVSMQDVVLLGPGMEYIEKFTAPADGYFVVNYSGLYEADSNLALLEKKTEDVLSECEFKSTSGKIIGWSSGNEYDSVSGTITDYIDVEGVNYLIYQRFKITSATANMGMAFYKSDKSYLCGQPLLTNASSLTMVETMLPVPEGAKYARFTYYSDVDGFGVKIPIAPISDNVTTLSPVLYEESMKGSNGDFVHPSYLDKTYSTAKYIQCSTEFEIKSSAPYAIIYYYGDDFTYLGSSNFKALTADTFNTIGVMPGTGYIKIGLYMADNVTVPFTSTPTLMVKGKLGMEAYNVRPSDDGYHQVIVSVNCTDPSACDDETDDVQDNPETRFDYGVIALPPTYSNIGKPTRLILYCHGAAVNYESGAVRFNQQDLEPEYWLAEGYAVMDIEGNPYDNENEHFYIPQAMDCYMAAYKWALAHYNLCRDGIFLGGRSMGGAMTFLMLRQDCRLPVIAACPNVPPSLPLWLWNYYWASRRSFCATHMGFANQPSSWTNTQPLPTAEWNCLKENFDRLVRYSPLWALIKNLPPKNVLMGDDQNSYVTSGYDPSTAIYDDCRIKAKAPVKIFAVRDDPGLPIENHAMLWLKLLKNGSSNVEMRVFEAGGHHYDTQNLNLRTTVTTRFGEELTNIPVVYVEMLRFWRRFEQD